MKFKVIFLIFMIFGISDKAQNKTEYRVSKETTLDTLKYLKTFEANKAEYIGKPFSYLLSKMIRIQPKTVWIVPNSNDNAVVQKSLFRFYDMNYPIMNETKMLITWKLGLTYKTVNFNNRRNKFYFSDSERKFYENRIIEDILIYR